MSTRDGDPPFKRNIRAFLERTGTSMRALSIKAGLAPDTVKGILAGKSASSRGDTLDALARAMGMSHAELAGGSGQASAGASPRRGLAGYGERLAAARQKLGLEQADLAERIGVDEARVAMWEREELLPDAFSLAGLAALGISADLVLGAKASAETESSRIGDAAKPTQESAKDPYLRSFIDAWGYLTIDERAAWAALLDTRRKSPR